MCEIPDHPVCKWHLPVFHLLLHLLHLFRPWQRKMIGAQSLPPCPGRWAGVQQNPSHVACACFTFLPSLCLHVLYFLFHLVPDLFPCFLITIFNPFFTLQLHC